MIARKRHFLVFGLLLWFLMKKKFDGEDMPGHINVGIGLHSMKIMNLLPKKIEHKKLILQDSTKEGIDKSKD